MARPVVVRTAVPDDAEVLTQLWTEHLRVGGPASQVEDVRAAIVQATQETDIHMAVAEADGEVLGVVHVRAAAASPVNPDLVVQVYGPLVHDDHRRRGVGSALMETAVVFAEERGIAVVTTAALSTSRDSNRFFARLAMGPRAMLRVATTYGLRQRLSATRAPRGITPLGTTRNIDRVLAARRGRRQSRVL